MALATLTHVGRAALALAVAQCPLHLAWGIGDPAWNTPGANLPSLVDSTALVHEVGRRTPNRVGFVLPDESGDIIVPVYAGAEDPVQEARYRLVTDGTPTPFLYVQVQYNFSDASNAVISELGLFMNTELVDGLPEGQRYFTPGELKNPGLLLAVQIIVPGINRSPSMRQSNEFVMPV